jgi:hypothetical protein
MRIWYIAIACFALAIGAAERPEKVKSASEWTLEERIAARLARNSPGRRVAERGSEVRSAGEEYFEIDGRTNPELLLPFELFGSLVNEMASEDRFLASRRLYDEGIIAAGWTPDEFWNELRRAVKPYLAAQGDSLAIQQQLAGLDPPTHREAESRITLLDYKQCRLRADALREMRERFGPAFDEFLYNAVAPHLSLGSSAPDPDEAERLRFVEGGCDGVRSRVPVTRLQARTPALRRSRRDA